MSGAIGSGSSYGNMSQLIANSTSIHLQLNTLTEQVSTGMVAETYAGLGSNASVSLDLNPQLTALQAAQDSIGQAIGTMQVSQNALTQIQQVAATFASAIPNLNGLNASDVDSIASQANAALLQVADLLDTQDGSDYVFGGQDSANPPVPLPGSILSSGFYTQISAAVAGLGGSDAATTAAATLKVASSNVSGTSPFSAYMSQPVASAIPLVAGISPPVVETGEGGTVPIGLLASSNSVAVSTGTSTTGSYMRDLLRSLATLGSLSSTQIHDTGFGALVQDTGASLTGVVSAMASDVGILGTVQSKLTATQTQLANTATAITSQLSSVQDVNMAATLSELTAMQTQLTASYKLITGENSLSLVNFLPTT